MVPVKMHVMRHAFETPLPTPVLQCRTCANHVVRADGYEICAAGVHHPEMRVECPSYLCLSSIFEITLEAPRPSRQRRSRIKGSQ